MWAQWDGVLNLVDGFLVAHHHGLIPGDADDSEQGYKVLDALPRLLAFHQEASLTLLQLWLTVSEVVPLEIVISRHDSTLTAELHGPPKREIKKSE